MTLGSRIKSLLHKEQPEQITGEKTSPIKATFKKLFVRRSETRPQAGVRFGISWPLLFALSLILVCAVGWAFFMGLMVGRGQNPKTSIQNMAGIEPAPEIAAPPVLPEPFAVTEETTPEPTASALPSVQQAERAAPAQKATKPQQKNRNTQQRAQTGQQYDYTFQVAALRSQADAKKISSTLTKNGLKSSVRKSGKVWLTIISLRGAAADVTAMQKKLASLKMGKAMQLSRKAVTSRKGK